MTPLAQLVGAINIRIDPVLVDAGGFEVTWHGFFTAVGIGLGVWLAIRLARGAGLNEDDSMSIAVVAVISGIVGARLLWVFEHTDQISEIGDIFALTDGGISVYGAMIGGVLGAFIYVTLFKPRFPKWVALDVAAPGMILGQAVGRLGDTINGEHFAQASNLPWAFRYTHPSTDGPWAQLTGGDAPPSESWYRGARELAEEGPVAVHPVAGGYEPLLDFAVLGLLLWMRTKPIGAGWRFVVYVLAYAAIRGSLSLLRTDEATVAAGLSVPQLLAVLTAAGAVVMALYLWRRPQPPAANIGGLRRGGGGKSQESGQSGQSGQRGRRTHPGSRRGGLGRG